MKNYSESYKKKMLPFKSLKNGKSYSDAPLSTIYQALKCSEQVLTDTLKKRNVDFQILEDRLKQFAEKVDYSSLFLVYYTSKL